MTVYVRIWTPFSVARTRARSSIGTWKPSTIASLALASRTSDSEMLPTAEWMILIFTSRCVRFESDLLSTSREPFTSHLSTTRTSAICPLAMREERFSTVTLARERSAVSRPLRVRPSATSRAASMSAITWKVSPGEGTVDRPVISAGIAGPASVIGLPLSSYSARTRPYAAPQIMTSPFRRVPFCTSTVASGPRPSVSFASSTAPVAGRSGFAFRSRSSASRPRRSTSSGIPFPVSAETCTKPVFPPHSSGFSPRAASWDMTRFALASFLSILFSATTTGTPAAFAWL